nr:MULTISPECIES: hypothetical protein [Peribacillus]
MRALISADAAVSQNQYRLQQKHPSQGPVVEQYLQAANFPFNGLS